MPETYASESQVDVAEDARPDQESPVGECALGVEEAPAADPSGPTRPEAMTAGHAVVDPDKPLSQWTTAEVGAQGESLCASYLEKRGYQILERNWRCEAGEVDVVAKDGDTVVLVEVKTRIAVNEDETTVPELAVDARKQLRYKRLALLYLAMNLDVANVRFDVVAINIVGERCARLRHLIGAYEWDD